METVITYAVIRQGDGESEMDPHLSATLNDALKIVEEVKREDRKNGVYDDLLVACISKGKKEKFTPGVLLKKDETVCFYRSLKKYTTEDLVCIQNMCDEWDASILSELSARAGINSFDYEDRSNWVEAISQKLDLEIR